MTYLVIIATTFHVYLGTSNQGFFGLDCSIRYTDKLGIHLPRLSTCKFQELGKSH